MVILSIHYIITVLACMVCTGSRQKSGLRLESNLLLAQLRQPSRGALELLLRQRRKPGTILIAGAGTKGTKTPGGERNTGRLLAERIVGMGFDAACVARTPEAADELKAAGLAVAGIGDLTDAKFAEKVMRETNPTMLYTSVGGKDVDGQRVDGVANINLFKAAVSLEEPPDVVFITSWGCGETWDFINEQTRTFLGPALQAKTEAEDFLRSTELRHVIVRPGGLLPGAEPCTNCGILVKNRPDVGGSIRRQDLVELLVNLPRDFPKPPWMSWTNSGKPLTALGFDTTNAEPPLRPEEIVHLPIRRVRLRRYFRHLFGRRIRR